MKKLIILLVLCTAFIKAEATPTLEVVNYTDCPVTITLFSFNPATCLPLYTETPVVIAAHSLSNIPIPSGPAYAANAYFTNCPSAGVNTSYNTSCSPVTSSAYLPNCTTCIHQEIVWASNVHIEIHP
ncbi:MAG TPA: hypothetical protein VN721_07485 [Flavipsychrobacter sp.]|nr:hypothetical protein [Flavipsychrobacter sp.]